MEKLGKVPSPMFSKGRTLNQLGQCPITGIFQKPINTRKLTVQPLKPKCEYGSNRCNFLPNKILTNTQNKENMGLAISLTLN